MIFQFSIICVTDCGVPIRTRPSKDDVDTSVDIEQQPWMVSLGRKVNNHTLGKQRYFRVIVKAPWLLKWRSMHLRGTTSGTKFVKQKSNDHGSGGLYLKGCVFQIILSILEANAPVMPMLFLANWKLIFISSVLAEFCQVRVPLKSVKTFR